MWEYLSLLLRSNEICEALLHQGAKVGIPTGKGTQMLRVYHLRTTVCTIGADAQSSSQPRIAFSDAALRCAFRLRTFAATWFGSASATRNRLYYASTRTRDVHDCATRLCLRAGSRSMTRQSAGMDGGIAEFAWLATDCAAWSAPITMTKSFTVMETTFQKLATRCPTGDRLARTGNIVHHLFAASAFLSRQIDTRRTG